MTAKPQALEDEIETGDASAWREEDTSYQCAQAKARCI